MLRRAEKLREGALHIKSQFSACPSVGAVYDQTRPRRAGLVGWKQGPMQLSSDYKQRQPVFANCPLPRGEGGAKRRVRAARRNFSSSDPHPALRATFSPREKDTLLTLGALSWTALVIDRPYRCPHMISANLVSFT